VEDLWPDGELVGRIVGLGARLADRTATTGRGMEADAYHGIARDIPAWGPLDAGLPLGAAGLLGLPIDDEGAQIIPLARPPLVAIRPKGRADHVDLMRGVGGDESLGIDIAAVEPALFGGPHDHTGAKLAENRAVESGISELQTEGRRPIDPTAHGLGSPAI
jgi:hypothetical protein